MFCALCWPSRHRLARYYLLNNIILFVFYCTRYYMYYLLCYIMFAVQKSDFYGHFPSVCYVITNNRFRAFFSFFLLLLLLLPRSASGRENVRRRKKKSSERPPRHCVYVIGNNNNKNCSR